MERQPYETLHQHMKKRWSSSACSKEVAATAVAASGCLRVRNFVYGSEVPQNGGMLGFCITLGLHMKIVQSRSCLYTEVLYTFSPQARNRNYGLNPQGFSSK